MSGRQRIRRERQGRADSGGAPTTAHVWQTTIRRERQGRADSGGAPTTRMSGRQRSGASGRAEPTLAALRRLACLADNDPARAAGPSRLWRRSDDAHVWQTRIRTERRRHARAGVNSNAFLSDGHGSTSMDRSWSDPGTARSGLMTVGQGGTSDGGPEATDQGQPMSSRASNRHTGARHMTQLRCGHYAAPATGGDTR